MNPKSEVSLKKQEELYKKVFADSDNLVSGKEVKTRPRKGEKTLVLLINMEASKKELEKSAETTFSNTDYDYLSFQCTNIIVRFRRIKH